MIEELREKHKKSIEDNADAVNSPYKVNISRQVMEDVSKKATNITISFCIDVLKSQLEFNNNLAETNKNTPYGKDFCSGIYAIDGKIRNKIQELEKLIEK